MPNDTTCLALNFDLATSSNVPDALKKSAAEWWYAEGHSMLAENAAIVVDSAAYAAQYAVSGSDMEQTALRMLPLAIASLKMDDPCLTLNKCREIAGNAAQGSRLQNIALNGLLLLVDYIKHEDPLQALAEARYIAANTTEKNTERMSLEAISRLSQTDDGNKRGQPIKKCPFHISL